MTLDPDPLLPEVTPEDRGMFVLLDDAVRGDGGGWLLQAPERVVVCWEPQQVAASLAALDASIKDGLTAAGYFAYELGYALEPALAPLLPPNRTVPLLWMGLFRAPCRLTAVAMDSFLDAHARGAYRVTDPHPALDREGYRQRFDQARALIAAGDVYQINFTFPLRFGFVGDAVSLYRDLRQRQRVTCGGLIAVSGLQVLSLSPELFVDAEDRRARVRPMKGTARRGITPDEDAEQRTWLANDEKSRAENLMIVDLMRNDLSRLARTGSVQVSQLFAVETLRGLHQMISEVTAELRPGLKLVELLRALFPCGSVTGAPKVRAMQIIRALEAEPRGIYTGAIGRIDGRGCTFNVAIRTLVLHDRGPRAGQGEIGIGSGIVFDSDADAEYDECLLKAEFLTRAQPPITLVETLRWEPASGYVLLDRHLQRLEASAAYFVIPCNPAAVRAALKIAAAGYPAETMRVRLTLDERGTPAVTAERLLPFSALPLHFAISDRQVSSRDPLRYHKTIDRGFLDSELARWRTATNCDEVLFVNERGELTEGCWTNLFVQRGSRLLTPPVRCGLLDGTFRRDLLASRPDEVFESVLFPGDLANADAVFLGNSVRGLIPALPAASVAVQPDVAGGSSRSGC